MYRVKERGKDGTMFFDPQMEDRAVGRLDAVNALRAALDRGELVAHFQPIVELASGDVVSAEALLRWERPGHGLVPPLDFIPLAEETGLIQPIGAWILEEACTQARQWRADGHARVRVSVNVSARQLLDPEFERMVEQTLRKTGLEPDALVLEVTESTVMQNAELTIPKLERIVATGVRLSLDDFGEGYSSLSHIRRLPIQGLKIARPFVRELGDRGRRSPAGARHHRARPPARAHAGGRGDRAARAGGGAALVRLPVRPGLPVLAAGARAGLPGAARRTRSEIQ